MQTIEHLEQLSGSDAFLFIAKGWIEMVEAGHTDGSSPSWSWDNQVVVARAPGGGIVGAIAWSYVKWSRQVFIHSGYVLPEFRRQGVYASLYANLKWKAKDLGALTIEGGVSPKNPAIIAAAVKQGRKPVAISYQEKL